MRNKQRMSQYPDPKRSASEWISYFVRINRSVDPQISLETLQGNILSAIPANLAQLLATRTQVAPSEQPMQMTTFVQIFEELASFREDRYHQSGSQRIETNRYSPEEHSPAKKADREMPEDYHSDPECVICGHSGHTSDICLPNARYGSLEQPEVYEEISEQVTQ
jgi:hypothetical protein